MFADSVEELAELSRKIGLDTGSNEAARLARAANVAAYYLELGLLVAAANEPFAITKYWSASLGAGDQRTEGHELGGELAVTAGIAVTGPTCMLLDASGRAALATKYGPTIAQSGRACLGAFEVPLENPDPNNKAEVLAINAYESLGLNVRPSVDTAAVLDSRRFALAEAGISVEGIRYYWHKRRWSIAAPGVSLSQAFLSRKVEDDRKTLAHVAGAGWFADVRYHRSNRELTDFALRLFPIAVDTIESGEALSTISLVPLEVIGFGTHGVYMDAAGGVDLTADKPGDSAEEIASKPDVGIGSWRLALRLGVPRFHAELVNRQHVLPTLDQSLVAERRTSVNLHVDLRSVFLEGQAYTAHLRLFQGPGDEVDAEFDTWGVQGEAWVRAGSHLLIGTTVELGRSFVFAEPSATLGTPPYGHLVLAQVGWRAGKTRVLH